MSKVTAAAVIAGWRPSDAKPKDSPGFATLRDAAKVAPLAPVPKPLARPPAF